VVFLKLGDPMEKDLFVRGLSLFLAGFEWMGIPDLSRPVLGIQ